MLRYWVTGPIGPFEKFAKVDAGTEKVAESGIGALPGMAPERTPCEIP
ncbi:MAG: hypothetical protein ACKOVA_19640 [Novosphingobium sp.]